MAFSRVPFGAFAIIALIICLVLPAIPVQGETHTRSPRCDGTSIDQGIAYALMLVALLLTYLIHPMDASSSYNLF